MSDSTRIVIRSGCMDIRLQRILSAAPRKFNYSEHRSFQGERHELELEERKVNLFSGLDAIWRPGLCHSLSDFAKRESRSE